MFKLEHHQKILTVLNALDADFFEKMGAYFGGGTLLTLLYGEYRWSKDIDFICPVGDGYRELRRAINEKGYGALFENTEGLEFPRAMKADQYGVRMGVQVDGTLIKLEIIAEGRIELGEPAYYDWCPVPCLNFEDSCTEKLLANADRWADMGFESRDLIDLAMLRLQDVIPKAAYDKAEEAYPVIEPLLKAMDKFQENDDYRKRCLLALEVNTCDAVNMGIALLAEDNK